MRLRKTKQTERTTYTYTYTDTDDKGNCITRRQTLRPGEDGVTEMLIQELHSMDDYEVRCNIRNLRPEMTKAEKAEKAAWIEEFKADFLIKYGYEPNKDVIQDAVDERYPKNWAMSLNQFESDEDGGDTSDRHAELADPNAFILEEDRLPPDIRRMREIVSTCTEKQQQAYRLVYIEGFTEQEAAGIIGCSQSAVHQRLNCVTEKIKNNF